MASRRPHLCLAMDMIPYREFLLGLCATVEQVGKYENGDVYDKSKVGLNSNATVLQC